MKKIIFPFVILSLGLLASCSQKFNIGASYKNITVIYAFLDKADTAHYVRVEKAFLDQTKNALTMAQQPDSSFYNNINVRIDRVTYNGSLFDTIHLYRVDLDSEGYPKQPGTFFTAPNYAYKFKDNLDPQYLYRVIVTNLTTGQVDSSTAPILDDVTPNIFFVDVIDDPSINQGGMDFSSTLPSATFNMDVAYQNTLLNLTPAFNYEGLNNPAYLSHMIIRFNWTDSNISNGATSYHSYDFPLDDQSMPGGSTSYAVAPLSLYQALATGMGTAPSFTVRLIDRVDILAYISTLDYYNYQQSSLTQGVGLTGTDIEPAYTNVKGNDALGLYTSRGFHTGKMTLTLNTVDSLMASRYLTNAHIVGTSYH